MACGIISPITRTPATEKIIAANSETALFRYMGRVSRHAALHKRSVTSIQWCLLTTEKIILALLAVFSLYFAAISRFKWSMDAKPIVRPDIMPDMIRHQKETVKSIHQLIVQISWSLWPESSTSCSSKASYWFVSSIVDWGVGVFIIWSSETLIACIWSLVWILK